MKILTAVIASSLLTLTTSAQSAAPDFAGTDANGKTHSKASCAGSVTVLEWVNPDCPYVLKFYRSGVMQKLQKDYAGRGVKWLSIASSGPGQPGHLDAAGANAQVSEWKAAPTGLLLDEKGSVGKAFGAKRTPWVVILDAKSRIVYSGGLDGEMSFDPKRIDPKKNYVRDALEQVLVGKPVSRSSSRGYGCSIKYAP